MLLATQEGAKLRELCRRYRDGGVAALEDRFRRPRASPTRTDPAIEARIIAP